MDTVDADRVTVSSVAHNKMVNPELASTFAFYGSILLAKMGLMGPLTARQRFRKMVKIVTTCSTCVMISVSFMSELPGIRKPRGYRFWRNCLLCGFGRRACPPGPPERPRKHPPILVRHPLLPGDQPLDCRGHQLDQGIHRPEVPA